MPSDPRTLNELLQSLQTNGHKPHVNGDYKIIVVTCEHCHCFGTIILTDQPLNTKINGNIWGICPSQDDSEPHIHHD